VDEALTKQLTRLVENQSCFGCYYDPATQACQLCPVKEQCKQKEETMVDVKRITKKDAEDIKKATAEATAQKNTQAAKPAPANGAPVKAVKAKPETKPQEKKEKGKPGPKGRRYDPQEVEQASWLSILPPTELPNLTKGEKLLSNILHDEIGCEMVIHSDNTPRYFRLRGGNCCNLHIHGTPQGVALCYQDKKIWVGKPEDLVEVIKTHIKNHPAPARKLPSPPKKEKKQEKKPQEPVLPLESSTAPSEPPQE
jgi:hypothetical protein